MQAISRPLFSSDFYEQKKLFEHKDRGCYVEKDGQITASLDARFDKEKVLEVMQKIKLMDWAKVLAALQSAQRECLLNNLIALQKAVLTNNQSHSPISGLFSRGKIESPFYIEATTVGTPDKFTDCIQCDLFTLQHFTTYPTSDPILSVPTDHAGCREIRKGMRIGVCDGLGHWDPKGIGLVASRILGEVLNQPLTNQADYHNFLRRLNKDYKAQEGTMVLAAEIRKTKKTWKINVANYGDSALLVITKEGKICFSTKNRICEKKPDSEDSIGMLGIGNGLSDQLIEYADYHSLSIDEGWVVACSDGLIHHYRDSKGNVDCQKFETVWKKDIGLYEHGANLRKAVINDCRLSGKGDDVSIIVLKLP